MKIPDVNILVYAHNQSSPFHQKSLTWLTKSFTDLSDPIAIPIGVALGFVRSVCNPSIFSNPMTIEEACAIVVSWYESGANLLDGTPDTVGEIANLVKTAHGAINLLTDAYLAALAIQNRATIYSNDHDFHRFPGLKVRNPVDS